MDDDHVSLYRCQRCSVRMYLLDCASHHVRCRGEPMNVPLERAFDRGPRDHYARPGGGYRPRYAQNPHRRSPKPAVDHDDDDT